MIERFDSHEPTVREALDSTFNAGYIAGLEKALCVIMENAARSHIERIVKEELLKAKGEK